MTLYPSSTVFVNYFIKYTQPKKTCLINSIKYCGNSESLTDMKQSAQYRQICQIYLHVFHKAPLVTEYRHASTIG
jgi:dTDP-D-glucose 4,6-dehydratase